MLGSQSCSPCVHSVGHAHLAVQRTARPSLLVADTLSGAGFKPFQTQTCKVFDLIVEREITAIVLAVIDLATARRDNAEGLFC